MDEIIIAVVRCQNRFKWYRCERENWIMDLNKLRDAFSACGYSVPELDETDRFGIHAITDENTNLFFEKMKVYEVERDQLSFLLAKKFPTARSWWDVAELFPMVFVDFDNKTLGAFYYEGVKMEKYLPDGWEGEFIDFANEYPEEKFPVSEKFWVKGGSDLLRILNDRASIGQ